MKKKNIIGVAILFVSVIVPLALPYTLHAAVTCPQGSVNSPTNADLCIKSPSIYTPTDLVSNKTCPSLYSLSANGLTCTSNQQSYLATFTTSYSCPSGGVFNGSGSCNIAASSSGGGTYSANSSTSYTCPSGGNLNYSTCYIDAILEVSVSSAASCLSGGTRYAQTSSCYNGSTYIGVYGYSACPSGSNRSGDYCVYPGRSASYYTATGTTTYSCNSIQDSRSGTTCTQPSIYTQPSSYNASSSVVASCPTGGNWVSGSLNCVFYGSDLIPTITNTATCSTYYSFSPSLAYCVAFAYSPTSPVVNTWVCTTWIYGTPYETVWDWDASYSGYLAYRTCTQSTISTVGEFLCETFAASNGTSSTYISQNDLTGSYGTQRTVCSVIGDLIEIDEVTASPWSPPSGVVTQCSGDLAYFDYLNCMSLIYV